MPKILRSDKGPEFVSKALLKWAAGQNRLVAAITRRRAYFLTQPPAGLWM